MKSLGPALSRYSVLSSSWGQKEACTVYSPFLIDDVIMTSTVDAVVLKNAALHDIRYLSYMYVRPGGTL